MQMTDSVSAAQRLAPPSRWRIRFEEWRLQHDLAVLRADLEVVGDASQALDATVGRKLDELLKLLDYQRRRGFAQVERMHWPLVLVNWQLFGALILCAIGLCWLAGLLR